MGIIMIVMAIGILAMWFALHVIIYKNNNKPIKIVYFIIGSLILYLSLSYCLSELLKYKV